MHGDPQITNVIHLRKRQEALKNKKFWRKLDLRVTRGMIILTTGLALYDVVTGKYMAAVLMAACSLIYIHREFIRG